MATFEDHVPLKQEETDDDFPAIKIFICSLCGFKFSQERYLTNHFNFCENEKPEHRLGPGLIILQSEPSKEWVQSAELCDRKSTSTPLFDIKTELEITETSISGSTCPLSGEPIGKLKTETLEQLQCIEREYTTEESVQLKEHIKVHVKQQKPYKCDKCEYTTTKRRFLKTHNRRHTRNQSGKVGVGMRTREKRFKCELCDYVSAQTSNLKNHMKKHAGEKPFKCTLCDYPVRVGLLLECIRESIQARNHLNVPFVIIKLGKVIELQSISERIQARNHLNVPFVTIELCIALLLDCI